MNITDKKRQIITTILDKANSQTKRDQRRLVSFAGLYKLLNTQERKLIEGFLKIKPDKYGFKGPFLGLYELKSSQLVKISNQKYTIKTKQQTIDAQFLPKPVYVAYKNLNRAIYRDIKKRLLVLSGYRSPAYQVVIFLYYLKHYKFNFTRTAKRVALPGYSEHGYPQGLALDFITTNGIPSDVIKLDFSQTPEYKWLIKNANLYGFALSYKRSNQLGVIFEPWHWHFEGGQDD